jgi:hypothetical protein
MMNKNENATGEKASWSHFPFYSTFFINSDSDFRIKNNNKALQSSLLTSSVEYLFSSHSRSRFSQRSHIICIIILFSVKYLLSKHSLKCQKKSLCSHNNSHTHSRLPRLETFLALIEIHIFVFIYLHKSF